MPDPRWFKTAMGLMVITDTHKAIIDKNSMPENYEEELTKLGVVEALVQKVNAEGEKEEGKPTFGRIIEWPTK